MKRASRWIAGGAIHVDSGSSFKHSMARSVGSLLAAIRPESGVKQTCQDSPTDAIDPSEARCLGPRRPRCAKSEPARGAFNWPRNSKSGLRLLYPSSHPGCSRASHARSSRNSCVLCL